MFVLETSCFAVGFTAVSQRSAGTAQIDGDVDHPSSQSRSEITSDADGLCRLYKRSEDAWLRVTDENSAVYVANEGRGRPGIVGNSFHRSPSGPG